MELECTFDIQRDVLPFVLSRRADTVKEEHPDADITVRIVGQERDGALLYTWDDLVPIGDSRAEVTHIGLHEPVEQKNKCLFVHDCKMFIVNCSINQERSMLAYVVKETQFAPSSQADEDTASMASNSQQGQDVYRAFLAEIQPQHAIFDLNLERSALLYVQFLWPRSAQGLPDTSASANKDSRLLVFLHRESIGLYRVPIARIGDSRVVMSGPPDAQPVVNRFLWAQWDAPTQRLFVVLKRIRQPNEPEPPALFRCLEFTGQGSQTTFTKMMEMELPPEIKLPPNRYSYELPSLRNTISDKAINMYVVCQPGGSLCVCYQLPLKRLGGSKSSSRRHSKTKIQIPHSIQSDQTPGGQGSQQEGQRRPGSLDLSLKEESASATSQPGVSRESVALPRATTPVSTPSPAASLGRLASPTTPLTDSSLNLSYESATNGTLSGVASPQYWSTVSSPLSDSISSPVTTLRTLLDQKLLTVDSPAGPKSSSQFVDVHYLVLVLHHKAILHCSVPHVQKSVAKRMQLHFAPMNGYLMTYYPGTVLHLLNVNPEMEPCLHLAFEPRDIPWIPLPGAGPDPSEEKAKMEHLRSNRMVLTHFQRDRTISKSDDLLFDGLSGRCFQPVINREKLPLLLTRDSLISFKLGLLHLAVINIKDAMLNKKIIESITQDPFELELQDLLAEFLLAGTFCCVRLKLERDILRYLPFTKVDTTKTVFIETPDGSRIASFKRVESKYIPKIFLSKKGRRDKRLGPDATSYLWETLERQVRKNQDWVNTPSKKFDTRSLTWKLREQDQARQLQRSEEKAILPPHPQNARSSLLKKVAAFSKRALSSNKEVRQLKPKDPLVAVMTEDDTMKAPGIDTDQNKHIEMMLDELVSFFRSRMPFHNQDRLVSYASEFVGCQLQQFKLMLSLLIAANGFTESMEKLSQVPLSQPASENDESLFHAVERLFSAAQNLCFPLPVGFKHFFVCLGYRCLDAGMFLQYVNQGVFEVSETFMTQMVKDVSDEDSVHVDLKMKLIQRLLKASADRVLMEWNHPSSNLIVAQQYAASCLHDGAEIGQRNLSAAMAPQTRPQKSNRKSMDAAIPGQEVEEDYLDDIPDFPPLTYFMRLIEGAERTWLTPSKAKLDIRRKTDSQFVGRVALQSSVREHGLDLGGIAF